METEIICAILAYLKARDDRLPEPPNRTQTRDAFNDRANDMCTSLRNISVISDAQKLRVMLTRIRDQLPNPTISIDEINDLLEETKW